MAQRQSAEPRTEKIELPSNWGDFNYDDWLEFFRKQPAQLLYDNQRYLRTVLPSDGYAAAARWIEIWNNPSKMDKLHKTQLKAKQDKSVMELAVGDDDEAFYEALIKENVEQLNSGNVSPQEVARLSQNINIFRKELREIRSRKPKSNTKLAKVLAELNAPKKQGHESASEAPKPEKTITKPSGEKDA